MNRRRKSTVGWAIGNILLDFTGGALSIAQLMLDGATEGWGGVVGDPIKFCLGFVSIFFDIIFMVSQIMICCPPVRRSAGPPVRRFASLSLPSLSPPPPFRISDPALRVIYGQDGSRRATADGAGRGGRVRLRH